MAQAYVNKQGYFQFINFPLDGDYYLWIGKKKGQPVMGVFKKTRHGRKGLTLTPDQFQELLDIRESI